MKVQLLIRFLLIVFCLSMMIASAKAGINEGIEYYQKRQEGSKGTLASVENINKAIELDPANDDFRSYWTNLNEIRSSLNEAQKSFDNGFIDESLELYNNWTESSNEFSKIEVDEISKRITKENKIYELVD